MVGMDWTHIQEILSFLVTLFGPFGIWFAGKFIFNRWEKRNKAAESDTAEAKAKQAEADLVLVYEGLVRRTQEDMRKASDEAISKTARWQQIESEWNERLRKMDDRITDQNKDIAVLRSENAHLIANVSQLQQEKIQIANDNKVLQQEKLQLVTEVANLRARVDILEKELQEKSKSV